MAKVQKLPLPPPPEDEEDHECPKCPPVGAPAWMATFADIATLLMAFFVLILAFAQFDEPSFKKLAGSMREAFGVQMVVPALPEPLGTTIIDLSNPPSDTPPNKEPNEEAPRNTTGSHQDSTAPEADDAATKALADALAAAAANGQLTVESGKGQVVVRLPDDASQEKVAQMAEAIAEAAGTTPQKAPSPAEAPGETAGSGGEGQGGGSAGKRRAAIADARLRIALREQTGQGLVNVETQEDRVVVTVGAGGAFTSGSAELTDEARKVMEQIALSSFGPNTRVTVTGHTDSVPLGPGSAYGDNWGLAAARASNVVSELGATGFDPTRLTAISRGESTPVASNETEEGREKNRRIEIEITYGNGGD